MLIKKKGVVGVVRYIGMDVHREFAQVAVAEDGLVRDEGRIGVTPEALRQWAGELRLDDQVALEATGNSDAIANLLTPIVGRVVVSNPAKTRAIAEAKVKTDKVDARILAQLLAADFLPPVWLPDDRTRALRRQVTRRAHLVRQRTRIKNQMHAILARNLAPTPPVSDLFGKTGRHWLSVQPLPADERSSVQALLRQLDFHGAELAVVDNELAVEALTDPVLARLMTIPGVDAIAGMAIVAAVGDFYRFPDADRLVAYVGLNPKVRQSGNRRRCTVGSARPAGPRCAASGRGGLVGQPSARAVRAFFQRIKARRGFQTAVVATARKLTVLAWHLVLKTRTTRSAGPAWSPTRAASSNSPPERRLAAGTIGCRVRLQRHATTQRSARDRRAGRTDLPGLRGALASQQPSGRRAPV